MVRTDGEEKPRRGVFFKSAISAVALLEARGEERERDTDKAAQRDRHRHRLAPSYCFEKVW